MGSFPQDQRAAAGRTRSNRSSSGRPWGAAARGESSQHLREKPHHAWARDKESGRSNRKE